MKERFIFIGIGTALMLVLSIIRRKHYNLPLWKSIAIPFVLAICGVLGTMILYFIETGKFGGISFYGAILLVPALLFPISKLLKIPYEEFTDYSVPQGCVMLASMKISCFMTGCCGGICLNPATGIYFPSQIAEMIVSLLIAAFVMYLDGQKLLKGRLYGVYFLVYGITRFALNFLREGISPFIWFIPAGHFWSLISIGLGITWILFYERLKQIKNKNRQEDEI